MGRTILAEDRVQDHVNGFFKAQQQWQIGLIIGQLTNQRDYALHLVRTPPPEEDHEVDDKPAKKAVPVMVKMEDMDEHWVATHAKQVQRMLPGGLDVIGIFATGAPDVMKNAQTKLRQIIFAVHKSLTRSQIIPHVQCDITERVLLQICTATRKLTCRTFDISDHKCTAKPAEWKFQSFMDRWSQLETKLAIEVAIPVASASLSQTLNKQLQSGLAPFCEKVWSALGVVDGQLRDPEEGLDNSGDTSTSRKGKGKDKTIAKLKKFDIDLLMQLPKVHSQSDPKFTTNGASLLVRGIIVGRAYVHNKSTVKEGIQAVKTDVIRSLVSRCDLLCEDLLQNEEEQDPRVLYETPIRVFAKLPSSPLTLCDYMFQDETLKDCVERWDELMAIQLEEGDLDVDIERVPLEEELIKPEKQRHKKLQQKNTSECNKMNIGKYIGALVGGGVGILAAGLSYLYLGQD